MLQAQQAAESVSFSQQILSSESKIEEMYFPSETMENQWGQDVLAWRPREVI